MNLSGDEWKFSGESRSDYDLHGEFRGRLSLGITGTTEAIGYSMWHLVAAKLCSPELQKTFLESAYEIAADTLIDDLREGMAVFPDYCKSDYLTHAPYQNTRRSWRSVRESAAFKTPLEICQVLGYPLIWWPQEWEAKVKLHPVIKAAQVESARLIAWPEDELIL